MSSFNVGKMIDRINTHARALKVTTHDKLKKKKQNKTRAIWWFIFETFTNTYTLRPYYYKPLITPNKPLELVKTNNYILKSK